MFPKCFTIGKVHSYVNQIKPIGTLWIPECECSIALLHCTKIPPFFFQHSAQIKDMFVTTDRLTFCSIIVHAVWCCVVGYTTMYTNRPINGFYCPDGHLPNITDIDQQQCTRHCLIHQACRVMSYNPIDRVCTLGEIPCDVAVSHPNYLLMVFRAAISVDCIIWANKSYPFPSRTVYTIFTYPEALCGKQVGSDFLIGHGRGDQLSYFGVRNAGQYYHMESFVLTVNPVCTLAWVPYVAESTLPKNALVCGHLAAAGPTYCARIRQLDAGNTRIIFGYYSEWHKVAYYGFHGTKESVEMDILTRV